MLELSLIILIIRSAYSIWRFDASPGLDDTVEMATSVKIRARRDGGIGRRVGLRIQCPKGVQVQILFPAPAFAPDSHQPAKVSRQAETANHKSRAVSPPLAARLKSCPFPKSLSASNRARPARSVLIASSVLFRSHAYPEPCLPESRTSLKTHTVPARRCSAAAASTVGLSSIPGKPPSRRSPES